MWGNRARASRGFRVAALDFPYLGRGGKQNWITAAAVRSPRIAAPCKSGSEAISVSNGEQSGL